MMLKLEQYDIDLVYVLGTDTPLADALSRNYLNETGDPDVEMEAHVLIIKSLPTTSHGFISQINFRKR